MDELICRLCLRITVDSYSILEDDLRATLDNSLLQSVLNVSEQPNMVCSGCRNNIRVFCNFKRACVDIRDGDDLKIDNIHIKSIVKDSMTCTFCGKIVDNLSFISLSELRNACLLNMPEEHNTELNLNVSGKIPSCEPCRNSLQGLQNFITNYFDVEEKIRKYAEVEGVDDYCKIELKKLLECTFKPILQKEIGSCSTVKMEALDEDPELFVVKAKLELKYENEDGQEPSIKHEEILIKSEENEDEDDDDEPNEYMGEHVSNNQGRKLYKCKDCTFETIYASSIKQHMGSHKIKMLKCGVCSYQTVFKARINYHMLTHTDPSERRKYQCKDCPYETVNSSSMRYHRTTHMAPRERPVFKCAMCTYETKQKRYLKEHILTHRDPSERKKLKCKHCAYEMLSKAAMRRHSLVHKDPSNHMLTHKNSSERVKIKCKVCSFETICWSSMRIHRMIHMDPEDVSIYKCKVCTYETKLSDKFERHLKIHNTPLVKRKYSCKNCAYETVIQKSMEQHVMTRINS